MSTNYVTGTIRQGALYSLYLITVRAKENIFTIINPSEFIQKQVVRSNTYLHHAKEIMHITLDSFSNPCHTHPV